MRSDCSQYGRLAQVDDLDRAAEAVLKVRGAGGTQDAYAIRSYRWVGVQVVLCTQPLERFGVS